jgi:hypothetical protein
MLTREQYLRGRISQANKVILGLLEVARLAMPDTYWQTDSRVNAARKYLGKKFPKE